MIKRTSYRISIFFISLLLAACMDQPSPRQVADRFWAAVSAQEMEKAKDLSTWDSVDYLKYLSDDTVRPERFELGSEMLNEHQAEVEVVLHIATAGQQGVKLPGKTVLVNTENGWRVNVKSTVGSVVRKSMDNALDGLNQFLQEGLKQFDKTLSESMKNLGEALKEGSKELEKELKELVPDTSPRYQQKPGGREI